MLATRLVGAGVAKRRSAAWLNTPCQVGRRRVPRGGCLSPRAARGAQMSVQLSVRAAPVLLKQGLGQEGEQRVLGRAGAIAAVVGGCRAAAGRAKMQSRAGHRDDAYAGLAAGALATLQQPTEQAAAQQAVMHRHGARSVCCRD